MRPDEAVEVVESVLGESWPVRVHEVAALFVGRGGRTTLDALDNCVVLLLQDIVDMADRLDFRCRQVFGQGHDTAWIRTVASATS